MIQRIPAGRKVVLKVVGNTRAQEVGFILAAAIRAAGHGLEYVQIGMMVPEPHQPLTVHVLKNHAEVILAPGVLS